MDSGVEVATHVDDFMAVGPESALLDFYRSLQKEFELKCTVIGGLARHSLSGVYLGRTITWTSNGYTWEADLEHARELIRSLGLEQCKPCTTPHAKEQGEQQADDDQELSDRDARAHRGNVAHVVYLAQGRMDLSVAACALATTMAKPRQSEGLAQTWTEVPLYKSRSCLLCLLLPLLFVLARIIV